MVKLYPGRQGRIAVINVKDVALRGISAWPLTSHHFVGYFHSGKDDLKSSLRSTQFDLPKVRHYQVVQCQPFLKDDTETLPFHTLLSTPLVSSPA